mmetsp:Transcript_49417/g.78884  ORF Transcript_49417/g.78884 Transcript_49417/m.78884 type:complete len:233 (-) Transcript_49417:30-728(-)
MSTFSVTEVLGDSGCTVFVFESDFAFLSILGIDLAFDVLEFLLFAFLFCLLFESLVDLGDLGGFGDLGDLGGLGDLGDLGDLVDLVEFFFFGLAASCSKVAFFVIVSYFCTLSRIADFFRLDAGFFLLFELLAFDLTLALAAVFFFESACSDFFLLVDFRDDAELEDAALDVFGDLGLDFAVFFVLTLFFFFFFAADFDAVGASSSKSGNEFVSSTERLGSVFNCAGGLLAD